MHLNMSTFTRIKLYMIAFPIKLSKVDDRSRGRPESSFFNSYYTEVLERALLLSLDRSTLLLLHTLYSWVLSKEVSSTIF